MSNVDGVPDGNVKVCCMGLCSFYDMSFSAVYKLSSNMRDGLLQLPQHGLVDKVSNNCLDEEVITSLHHFFQGLKEQSEPHYISLVRTRTCLCTKNDNENIWLSSHYNHRKYTYYG